MIPLTVLYNRLSVPTLDAWIESVQLVDRLSGGPSTLSVTLCNADGRFLSSWRATRGDSIALSIPPAAPDVYAIRKISFSRAPALVTWEAEGRPATSRIPAGHGNGVTPPAHGALVEDRRSWDEPVTGKRLRDIAQQVCDECGLRLDYVARQNPVISYLARYNQTGFALLDRLCRRFALALRATADRVVIVALQAREDKSPPSSVVVPVTRIETLAESESTTPRSVRSARLDPRSARAVRYKSGDGDGTDIDLTYDAESAGEIYAAAVAESTLAVLDVVPTVGIAAGSVVDVSGLGLREVVEMRYSRTGDAERMSLTVRAV